ncbi:MAG: alpha/beta hydrolase [Filomicrobium sp.]
MARRRWLGERGLLYFFMTLLLVSGLGALIVVAGAPKLERALLYVANPTYSTTADAGVVGFTEKVIETPDGERLVAWYAPAREGQPTLLYFHGNAGTLADRSERITNYRALGRGVLIVSYRGYSGSTGQPTETRNVEDARLSYDTLVSWGIKPEDIIVYGESLGTGVAVQLAGSREVSGVVLDAPYTSIVDVATICYPYLPARLLMQDRYETLKHLKKVDVPLLVIHGELDAIVPVEMGRKVAASAPGPSEIKTFPEAGHTDHWQFGSFEAVNSWIDRLRKKPSGLAEAG